MLPRPLYRSRLLWLGVPGLVFLLWAWWDSFQNESQLRSRVRVSCLGSSFSYSKWQVALKDGAVLYERGRLEDLVPGAAVGRARLAVRREVHSPRTGKWPLWGSMRRQPRAMLGGTDVESEMWWCSFGFVVLGYVAVWLGAVVWWQRRKVRVMRRLTEMRPEAAG